MTHVGLDLLWVGSPFFVEINGNNTLMCSCMYWNQVKRAPKLYTRSDSIQQEDNLLNHVVHPKVLLHSISTENKLPNGCKKADAVAKNAMRLDINTHDEIVDGIITRETLEHVHIEDSDAQEELISGAGMSSGTSSNNCSSSCNSSDSE